MRREGQGEANMARYDFTDIDAATLAPVNANGEAFYELGIAYASGRLVPVDLVSAHKWFNIASMKGNADAARMRREIAAEMSDAEIGQAQRAARDWLRQTKAAPTTVAARAELRAAA
jgi:TPR repeat protein